MPKIPSAWPLALLLCACGSKSADSEAGSEPAPEGALEAGQEDMLLPPPEAGFQMRSIGTVIQPGEDIEYCEVGRVPGEEGEAFVFSHYELAFSGGSHHLILNSVEPGSEADDNLEVGDLIPCTGSHSLGQGLKSLATSQLPYHETRLPDGVGKQLIGGQKLVWNYHHLNTTDAPLDARHAFNVHTVREVEFFAKTAAFANRTVDIPAGADAEFVGECRFNDDIRVMGVSRHTHRLGRDFDVWFAGGERDGEHIWTSKHFELEVSHAFDEPILLKAGEGFRFRCAYDNTTDAKVGWGNEATDEMCILFTEFWKSERDQAIGRQSCFMQSIDNDGIARGLTIPDGIGAFD